MKKQNKAHSSLKQTLLSSAILLELTVGSAVAATINVDSDCTLIDAIQSANSDTAIGNCSAGSGADTIQLIETDATLNLSEAFGPSSFSPLSDVSIGLPAITSHITIEGNGLTIDADTSINKFRIFEVNGNQNPDGVSLTLKDTVVKGGNPVLGLSFGSVGGLEARRATVHLDNTQFIGNHQGAVSLAFSLGSSIKNSVFRDNTTFLDRQAMALQLTKSEVTIENTSFVNNRFDIPTFYDSYRQHNRVEGVDRGLTPSRGAAVNIYASDVSISNSTISGNTGFGSGGLSNSFGFSTRGLAQSSPFDAVRGTREPQTVSIINSTITDNTARVAAGILNNFTEDADVFNIVGSIISGNKSTDNLEGQEIFSSESQAGEDGTFNLDNFNIIGQNGDPGLRDLTPGSSDVVLQGRTSDLLYPLTESNNQFLHPLKAAGPAVDAIPAPCFDLVQDQEGNSRAMDGNFDGTALCDIGAFEKSAEIIVNETDCTLIDALISANADTSINGCTAGIGADVIQLPRGSEQLLTSVASSFNGTSFGLPLITSAIILEGNDSLITRDTNAPDFGIAAVTDNGDLLVRKTTLAQGVENFAGLFSMDGNLGMQYSSISNMNGIAFLSSYAAKTLIEQSTISNNTIPSGGLSLDTGNGVIESDSVKIRGSLFSGNSGDFGAALGLRNNRSNSIQNITVSGNSSAGFSAFVIQGAAQIDGITVTNNTASTGAGGAFFSTKAVDFITPQAVEIKNSIFSGNLLNSSDVRGVNESATEIIHVSEDGAGVVSFNNIFGQNSEAGVVDVEIDAESIVPVVGISAIIGPLQNNGGFSFSHEPIAEGLAVDTGDINCRLTNDQLNRIRPFDGNGDGSNRCDIGAIEFGSFNPDDLIFKNSFENQ
ncbi:choice-of-anchor Q domain-containing protein [Marinicella sp. W31]|uniref:choice-of-anchor Q domain-containing protein n=1 Tax=Marinicella sp. W31 TaxID=3023713 RepID=UPI003757D412